MFHILVVEDDRALRELFCTVLSKNGFVYHEARDGDQRPSAAGCAGAGGCSL